MRRWLPSLRGLPRAYWFVWTGMLVNKLGTFVVPFLVLYLTAQRGFSTERAGWVLSLYGLGTVTAAAVGGVLADRIGRRWTMIGGLGLGAVAMIQVGLARQPLHIMGAVLVLGLVAETYRPAMSAFVSDVVPPEDRARAYGLMYWAINIGFAISPVIAGSIAGRSFGWLFALDAATSATFAVIVFLGVPETRPSAADHPQARGLAMLEPLRDSTFASFLLVNLLMATVFFQFTSALPLDMRDHGLDARAYGWLISINGILITLFQPGAARALARFRPSQLLAGSALLVGAGYGVAAFASGALGYALSISVWTLGEIVMAGIGPAVVAELAPPRARGTYQGLFQMSWGGATFIAPVLGTAVLGRFGGQALWTGCFAVGLCSAVAHLAIAGPRERRLAGATPSAPASPTGRTAQP